MDYEFTLTRERSKANGKYEFEFIGNSRLAVVPVFQRYQSGEYRIIGTASYFIKPNVFITAAHIFEGNDINDEDGFYILSEDSSEPIPLIQKHRHETLDLALIILDPEGEKYFEEINPLAVMNLPPLQHEIVAVFGYSHSIVDPEETFESEDGTINQLLRIRSKWELGGVLEIHNQGSRLLKGQCFETSVLAEGRDSGAPMFNSNGFLVGLLSTSWNFEEGLPNSVCSSILELAEIPINEVPIKKLWNKKKRAAYCRVIKEDE